MFFFLSLVMPRRSRFGAGGCALFLSAAFCAASAEVAPSPQTGFILTTLGTLDNPGSSTVLRRVNSLGEAVGAFKTKGHRAASSAFMVSAASGFNLLTGQQLTDFSASYAINDLGETAGLINGPSSVLPFRATRHAGLQLLPLLGGDTGGAAYGLNQKGEAVGFSSGAHGIAAVWWTRNGNVTQLPSTAGYTTAKAVDINQHGDIVGYEGDSEKVAVLWLGKGDIISLGTLPNYTSSQAESISDNGDIAGLSIAYDPTLVRERAVLWRAGSTVPQDLGALPGGSTSRARDVDSNDDVVGTSDSSSGNRAFLWSPQGGMQDLNTLTNDPTIILIDAVSINHQGVILALGIKRSDLPTSDSADVEEHELPRQIVLLTPRK